MNIYGLQRLTLLDYPGHTACTVFLKGCNFHCPYCHNALLAFPENDAKPLMWSDGFLVWLESRKGKLDGVVISGGEPTLYSRLSGFIRDIKDMGFLVKLDTNGYNPSKLKQAIYECHVDYVAMDIKNSQEKYSATAGTDVEFWKIRDSVQILKESHIDYEFRTTVTGSLHSDEDFEKIGELIRGAKRYFLQKCTTDKPDEQDLQRYKEIMQKYVEYVEIRG